MRVGLKTPAQKYYTVGEQKLLAIVHALGIWRCYLEGSNVPVCTDHAPYTFLSPTVHSSRRQAHWSEFLQRFDITSSASYTPAAYLQAVGGWRQRKA